MLELRTLGTIDLRGEDGGILSDPLLHSKRLGLLAFLSSLHPARLHRRDALVALFWPHLDDSHGRGMLRHELYELRRVLGPGVMLGERGEAVGIDEARLWCDARAFDAALASGLLEEALELWHGEFLPGFHVASGAFDHWLERTRDRLTRGAIHAAERLTAQAEGCGDLAAAVRWARCWADLGPYDETAGQRLVALLDRAGDRAGALAAFDALATRLRDDLDVEPSPETCVLVAQIRERAHPPRTANALRAPAVSPSPEPEPVEPEPPRPVVVALRPVENLTGAAGHDALARRLTDRLAQGVSELPFIEVALGDHVPGATAVVSATLYGSAGRVETRTRLAEAGGTGRILAMPESVLLDEAPGDEQLDAVVARVLAAVSAQYDPRVPIVFVGGLPDRTPSWQAFLEFIQGAEAFGAYRFEEAARRLLRSHEIDPGWAKAGIFAAIARAYCGDPEGADALATAVMGRSGALSPYERHFGEWFLADLRGRRAEAYRSMKEVVRLTSHPVPRTLAGREAYRMNRPREAVRILEGSDQGLGWWRNWAEWYEVSGGAFHMLGDHRAELAEALRGRARLPDALEPIRAEVRARAALRESSVVLDLVGEALTLPPGLTRPAFVAWTAAQELEAHGMEEAGAAARRAGLSWLARNESLVPADRLLEIRMLLEAGQPVEALARFRSMDPCPDLELPGIAGLLAAAAGDTDAARQAVAQLEGLHNPYLSGRHLLLAAEVHIALSEPELAMDTLRRALAAGLPWSVELHARPMFRRLGPLPEFATLLRPRG